MTDDPASLSKLHDIAIPPDVSWWPLAPGSIILAVLAAVAVCYYGYRSFRHWKRNAYRREALAQLASANSPARIAEVLRRTALAISSREEVASLQGDAWVDWLAQKTATKPSDVARTTLTRSIYAPSESPDELSALREFAKSWISHHRHPC